jgi:hypothetical protein
MTALAKRDVHHFDGLPGGITPVRLHRRRDVGRCQSGDLVAVRVAQHRHRSRVPVDEHARFWVQQQHGVGDLLEQQPETPITPGQRIHAGEGTHPFQLIDCQKGQRLQLTQHRCRQRARLEVHDAENAEHPAVVGLERHAGIEADSTIAFYQRVIACPRRCQGVLDDMRRLLLDGGRAQSIVAGELAYIQAMRRLEPDPVGIDQADEGDRRVREFRSE